MTETTQNRCKVQSFMTTGCVMFFGQGGSVRPLKLPVFAQAKIKACQQRKTQYKTAKHRNNKKPCR
jgi:hypothetical protein